MAATRRSVAGAASLLAVFGTTTAGALSTCHPLDAALMRLCAEHDALERELSALTKVSTIEEERRVEAAAAVISDRQLRIADRIGKSPPSTPAGWRALAGTIALSFPERLRDEQEGHDDLLIATLVEGLLGAAQTG